MSIHTDIDTIHGLYISIIIASYSRPVPRSLPAPTSKCTWKLRSDEVLADFGVTEKAFWWLFCWERCHICLKKCWIFMDFPYLQVWKWCMFGQMVDFHGHSTSKNCLFTLIDWLQWLILNILSNVHMMQSVNIAMAVDELPLPAGYSSLFAG